MKEAGVFIPAEPENSDHDEEFVLADMSESESESDSDSDSYSDQTFLLIM